MATDDQDSGVPNGEPIPTPPGFRFEDFGPLGIVVPDPGQLLNGAVDTGSVEIEPGDHPTEEGMEEALQLALENETCSFCKDVIRYLMDQPHSEQAQGIRELNQLKRTMGEDTDREQLRRLFDQFEVLDNPEDFM